ncbi:MAG: methylenetetrahydrofolate--tRNA-(uracil(54)-C(5))-methyltransferase (FADH(2)-oxidizing) TrmFO, partial [Cyanobacteria bacterium P01_D01_bin.73]
FEFISSASPKHYQPMPPNFGIIPPLAEKVRNKKERYGCYRDRALNDLQAWSINYLQEKISVSVG